MATRVHGTVIREQARTLTVTAIGTVLAMRLGRGRRAATGRIRR
jgi:hypothetical protein